MATFSTKVDVNNFYFDDNINISPSLYSTMTGTEYVAIPTLKQVRMPTETRTKKKRIGAYQSTSRKRSQDPGPFRRSGTKSIGEALVGIHVNAALGRLLR